MFDPADLPAFTPVATQSTRHDGWTPERQTRFIHALATIGTVAGAARAVSKSATAAYKLRERPGADSFVAAWNIAQAMAHDRIFFAAVDRAMNGREIPRYYAGRRIGTDRRPDYRAMEAVLRNMPPVPAPTMSLEEMCAQLTDLA